MQAVERALTADISEGYADSRSYWAVFHIQSDVPDQPIPDCMTAEKGLGYSSCRAGSPMNLLILGANGMLGPHVVKSLEGEHTLRLTDVNAPPDTPHEYFNLDVFGP